MCLLSRRPRVTVSRMMPLIEVRRLTIESPVTRTVVGRRGTRPASSYVTTSGAASAAVIRNTAALIAAKNRNGRSALSSSRISLRMRIPSR